MSEGTDGETERSSWEVITKLDAARRQLEVAIGLYFDDGETVAIHTLAAAAVGILDDVAARRGDRSSLRRELLAGIRPERREEFRKRLDAARNFFKHGNRDPEGTIVFSAWESDMWMLDAALLYRRLTKVRPPVLTTFIAWSGLTWAKDIVVWKGTLTPEQRAELEREASGLSRAEFLRRAVAQWPQWPRAVEGVDIEDGQ